MNFKSADFLRAVGFLECLYSVERSMGQGPVSFGLERFRRFLAEVPIFVPMQVIHVAGSKGKGTVSTLLARYLTRTGCSVGLYTSPHIHEVRERIVVNGVMIPREDFVRYTWLFRDVMERMDEQISYFEFLTAMAFAWCADQGVEYMVCETGIGGRLDATNVVTPVVSVLTRIEEEHMEILGGSLEAVVREKLGIVKPGVPVVVGCQSEEVRGYIVRELAKKDAVHVPCEEGGFAQNVATAKASLEVLGLYNHEIFSQIVSGFSMRGRFEVCEIEGNIVVFDIAHTPESMADLGRTLGLRFPKKRYSVLISTMKDKNIAGIMAAAHEFASQMYCTSMPHERSVDASYLAQAYPGSSQVIPDSKKAFKKALLSLAEDEILVVTGSTYLLSYLLPV